MNLCDNCGYMHFRTDPCRYGRKLRLIGGSSEVEHRPSKSSVVGSIPTRRSNKGEAQKVERRSPKPEDAGSIPATFANAGSSNGRIADFDSADGGSNPPLASKRGRPRIHPDRKAAKAMYERNRRARLKASK